MERRGAKWIAWILASAGAAACGGSSGTLAGDDAGGAAAAEAGSTNGVDAGGRTTGDAAPPFNPGSLGGLVGGDGGLALGDAATSATVVDGCTQLCTAEAAAACPASGTLQSCVVGCQLLVGNAACAQQASALFACTAGQKATCDSSGSATFAGCGVQEVEAEGCFLQNTIDPTLATPCATYCADVSAAKCPNDNTSGCVGGCEVLGNLVSGCDSAWKAYVQCADTSTFSCGSDGKAAADGCVAQALTFWVCAATGILPLVSDGGATDGGTADGGP